MDENENSAGAENQDFVTLLEEYGILQYKSGRTGDWLTQEIEAAEQAVLDYVKRLEANQMPSDFMEMYALYLRDEERGDPALRDMRFAGYAAAFFTRYLRLMHPDWK
jgi:hypothetical protein